MPTLNWIGKDAVSGHHQQVPFRLLEDDDAHAVNADGSDSAAHDNLLVEGDNLEALKALLPHYAGAVKCVYIDPPYNTGNEGWSYNDNVDSPQIRRWLHETVGGEAEDLSRHDKWLSMMQPRLMLLHELLAEDGSLWMSIDDNEVHHARALLDSIFGRQNFVTDVVWQKRYTRSNNTSGFTSVVDHTLVFQKTSAFSPNLMPRTDEADDRYSNPDNDERGPWKAIPFLNPLSPEERPNLCYEIVQPHTGEKIYPDKKAWRSEESVYEKHLKENRIWWGSENDSSVPNVKIFLSEVRDGMTPINFWDY